MGNDAKPTIDLLKTAAGLVAQVVAPAVDSAFSLLKKGPETLARYVDQENQRRYEEFCQAAFDGDVFPENGADLTASELISMLRACTADIEDAKAPLYGRLASAIATQQVPQQFRYPLMKAVSTLTYGQIDRLRHAWIAHHYLVMPAHGMWTKSQEDVFKGAGGVIDTWDNEALEAHSMAKDGSLTKLGEHLVRACFSEGELTPEAIGERAWISNFHLRIMSYEHDNAGVLDLEHRIAGEARELRIMAATGAVVTDQQGAQSFWFGALKCTVILVDNAGDRLVERRHLFEKMLERGHKLVIVFLGNRDETIVEAFPSARTLQLAPDETNRPTLIMEEVLGALGESEDL